ncbi:MAG: acyltransferase family protein [Isosphaeraceae bacterium]
MGNLTESSPCVDAHVAAIATATRSGPPRPRFLYIDNLRILLTGLVVIHHAAVTYSDIPMWYYTEPAKDRSSVALDALLILDQTFFMGFFFLISGYFVPTSYDHKGGRAFLQDRLVRLGIPLAVFAVLLGPILVAGFYALARAEAAAKGADLSYWSFYLSSMSPGPLWFVEVLLLFCALYVLARRFWTGPVPAPPIEVARVRPPVEFMVAILGYSLTLAVLTSLWRMVVPVGQFWPIVGLPTPAYLPQYASLFVVGLVACRRGWVQALPVSAGWFGLTQALFATVAVVPIAFWARSAFAASIRTWGSILYATWDSLFAVGVIVALLVLFRQKLNRQGTLASVMSQLAYTVYIIHPLVLVALGYAFRWLHAIAVVKFALIAVLGIPLCWASAYLVRALPYAKRVL